MALTLSPKLAHIFGKIRFPENHVRVFGENATHVGFIVLAADCKDHAALLELQQRHLEPMIDQSDVGDFADLNAVVADIAQYAAPQRVVQIEDHAFN